MTQGLSLSLLEPGTLWQRMTERTQQALECGALLSIPTDYEFVEQNGVQFLVRSIANLVRKADAKREAAKQTATTGKAFNPFLPYDPDLFVADLSETHVAILNKFNVVDHHLLIITRAFESQESWLTLADFEAMWTCLAEIDGLAFYNGGKIAGASQPHKHLQLVPLPFVPDGEFLPIAPLFATASWQNNIGYLPGLPFVHAILRFDRSVSQSPQSIAQVTLAGYQTLLASVGLSVDADRVGSGEQSGAYNLLATRQWLMIVPRSQEAYRSISVNSLGFAGSLFVRNQEELQWLKQQTPLLILQQVGFARVEG